MCSLLNEPSLAVRWCCCPALLEDAHHVRPQPAGAEEWGTARQVVRAAVLGHDQAVEADRYDRNWPTSSRNSDE